MWKEDFEKLIASVRQESTSCVKQLDNLYYSKGDFTGEQAVQVLQAYRRSCDKMTAMQILETRMAPITCCERAKTKTASDFSQEYGLVLKNLILQFSSCKVHLASDSVSSTTPSSFEASHPRHHRPQRQPQGTGGHSRSLSVRG